MWWLARLEQLQAGRLGACANALLILLDPFVRSEMGSGQWSWEHTVILLVVQGTKIELLRALIQESSCSSCRVPVISQTSLFDFFSCLLFISCSNSPQLPLRSIFSIYRCIFQCPCERGWVQHPPTPLPSCLSHC